MDVARWSQPATATIGSGSQCRTAPAPTVAWMRRCDGRRGSDGSARDAATVRTHSRAPGRTSSVTHRSSPPSGPAAPPTRCTVSRAGAAPEQRRLAVHGGQSGSVVRGGLRDQAGLSPHRARPRTQAATGVAPGSSTSDRNTVGRSPRRAAASRAITARSAPHERREVGLVDDQQVGRGDAGAALARHLVAAGHVDHEDLVVDEALAEGGGQVVAAALHQHQVERSQRAAPGPRPRPGWRRCRRGWRCAGSIRSRPRGCARRAARRPGGGSRRPRWCRCRWSRPRSRRRRRARGTGPRRARSCRSPPGRRCRSAPRAGGRGSAGRAGPRVRGSQDAKRRTSQVAWCSASTSSRGAAPAGRSSTGASAYAAPAAATASQRAARPASTAWTPYGSRPSRRTAAPAGPVIVPYAAASAASVGVSPAAAGHDAERDRVVGVGPPRR